MPFLDWVNKAQAVTVAGNVPYHLLNFESAHGDPAADNMLIQGDNLLALKALLPFYRGQVKCVFIDPPYNTQSAFEHYDDKLEHSQWLSMMHPRLVLLRELMADTGSIWVTIDSNEVHYLKVVMDEVFGRAAFVGEIIWQKRTSRENRAVLSSSHDTVLLYAKAGPKEWKAVRNLLPASEAGLSNPDKDPRGPWKSVPFTAQGYRENQMYKIETPTGLLLDPPKGRCWGATEPEYLRLRDVEQVVYFPKQGRGRPRIKQFPESQKGLVPMTLWLAKDVGDNEDAKKESLALFTDREAFGTPKPERLIQHVLQIATNPGDLVLDSYLGSGTTTAVAHKMRRRYVGIEMGEHARTHCLPRLRQVIAGEPGGISLAEGWAGGGGLRFYTLGEPVFDPDGGINPKVSFGALAGYLWHFETGEPATGVFDSPLLGVHDDTAVFLLYNGILGDRKPAGGNVLTGPVLAHLEQLLAAATPAGQALPTRKVIYGETTRLGDQRLEEAGITFRQIPYDIRAR